MKHPYWHYFVALCEDVEKASRFVEPTPENFKTYSVEYARLYLAIGSEIDVVAKMLCKKIDPNARLHGITTYQPVIVGRYPDMPDVEVTVPRNDFSFTPWKDWRSGASPDWWKHYNGVKHERDKNFKEANLGNTPNALGGLLIVVGYLYADDLADCRFSPSGNFIRFDKKYFSGKSMGERGFNTGYRLPGVPKFKRP